MELHIIYEDFAAEYLFHQNSSSILCISYATLNSSDHYFLFYHSFIVIVNKSLTIFNFLSILKRFQPYLKRLSTKNDYLGACLNCIIIFNLSLLPSYLNGNLKNKNCFYFYELIFST